MTMTYSKRQTLKTSGLEAAKQMKGAGARLKALIYSDDRAGSLLWNMTAPTLVYSAELTGEIADSISAIDQAMKWGFGWSEGPFEMWDSIGVKNAVQKLEAEGWKVADWVKEMLAKGHETFYLKENGKTFCYCFESGEYRALQENKKTIHLSSLKTNKRRYQEKQRGKFDRFRRRCRPARISFEKQCNRTRHHPNAEIRSRGSRRQL